MPIINRNASCGKVVWFYSVEIMSGAQSPTPWNSLIPSETKANAVAFDRPRVETFGDDGGPVR